jgi:hypothetical protein
MGHILSRITNSGGSDDMIMLDNEDTYSPIAEPITPSLDNDFQMYDSDERSQDGSMPDLQDGSRWKPNGHREKQCPWCGEWIDLANARTGTAGLDVHEGSSRCRAKVRQNKQEAAVLYRNHALEQWQTPSSTSVIPSSSLLSDSSPSRPSPNMDEMSSPSPASFLFPVPYVLLELVKCVSYSILTHISYRSSSSSMSPCPGVPLIWNGGPIFSSYPHIRHNLPEHLGYRFCGISASGDVFQIQSIICDGSATVFGTACLSCQNLLPKVRKLYQHST